MTEILVYTVLAFEFLGIGSAVHAVMSTRTSQGAIAWALSLITFPPIAVPTYWVFGRRKFQGYVRARKEDLVAVRKIARIAYRHAEVLGSPFPNEPVASAAEELARVPVTRRNGVQLLIDGEATFASIFAGIDAARTYVLVQFYIVRDDQLGRELKQRMIAKAAQGLSVYFMYDEIGSFGLASSYLDDLRRAGVRVSAFHSRRGAGNRFQLNFRNHRKIVVVDGNVAWIGGSNVGDEYMGRSAEFGAWRDTHVRIEGPAVVGAQLSFAEDWHWATDAVQEYWNWTPDPYDGADCAALVLSSGPADELETAALMFIQAINSAQQRIWIASPYFVPDAPVVQAIQLAGLRGVDVRILIPDKSDNKMVELSAYSYLNEVKATGAKFYRYEAGFLHQKAALIDDQAALVGTANFDNRSFRLNFEITAIVIDEAFASQVEAMFEADFARSRLMRPGEYDEKPWWFRFAVRLCRLAAPVQ